MDKNKVVRSVVARNLRESIEMKGAGTILSLGCLFFAGCMGISVEHDSNTIGEEVGDVNIGESFELVINAYVVDKKNQILVLVNDIKGNKTIFPNNNDSTPIELLPGVSNTRLIETDRFDGHKVKYIEVSNNKSKRYFRYIDKVYSGSMISLSNVVMVAGYSHFHLTVGNEYNEIIGSVEKYDNVDITRFFLMDKPLRPVDAYLARTNK